jgi:hypothetical protein
VSLRIAIWFGLLVAGFICVRELSRPLPGYALLAGSVVALVWATARVNAKNLRSLTVVGLVWGVLVLLWGSSPAMGTFLLVYGAAPWLFHSVIMGRAS